MLTDKSSLFVERDPVSKKKILRPVPNSHDRYASNLHAGNGEESNSHLQSYFSNKIDLLKKIETRMQSLEKRDDNLLLFIRQLLEHLMDWVKINLPTSTEAYHGHEHKIMEKKATDPLVNKAESNKKENPCITKREMDVLNLLIKGLCAKEIANILFISETTVITHKKHLKQKFNARNSVELISKAMLIYG